MSRHIDFTSQAALQQHMDFSTTYHFRNRYLGNRHTRCVSKSPKYKLLTVTVVTYKIAPWLWVIFLLTQMIHIHESNELFLICTHQPYSHFSHSKQQTITEQLNQVVRTLNKQILSVNSTYLSGLLKARKRIKHMHCQETCKLCRMKKWLSFMLLTI